MTESELATPASGADWWETLPEPHKGALEGSCIYNDYYTAVLGWTTCKGHNMLVYSRESSIDELATQMNDAEDPHFEAMEFFDFNVVGGWIGDTTPFILSDEDGDEEGVQAMVKFLPGFLGYANRCSDKWYAVFEEGSPIAELKELEFHLSPDEDNDVITIPVLKLTRIK